MQDILHINNCKSLNLALTFEHTQAEDQSHNSREEEQKQKQEQEGRPRIYLVS
jgi:hypothetical protein